MEPPSRRDRQQLEIVGALAAGRLSRALGLALEHFDEFGVDVSVAELLRASIDRRHDAAQVAGLQELIDRAQPPTAPGA
jgi:hypothetical protein